MQDSVRIRHALQEKWQQYIAQYGNLFASERLSGASPPSVFVGSHGYPRVSVGPMASPVQGDASILDSPERWLGRSLGEIVNYRLGLVRGTQQVRADQAGGRYIESLQEMAMSSRPAGAHMRFERAPSASGLLDGQSAPFGPVAELRSASFDNASSEKKIERAYYSKDMLAGESVLEMYNSGVDVSQIQKCLSVGMLGKRRKLVPTKWSITATDDIISQSLVSQALQEPVIDSHRVFFFENLGNLFSVVLFPHRWMFEMVEAWYSGEALGFGSDFEDARGLRHPPAIAGAYHAARLAVSEYLVRCRVQAGALVLREIRPEYSVPVGVWQVREGVRAAMRQTPGQAEGMDSALDAACKPLSVSKKEWTSHGKILRMAAQRAISDYS